ncbi:MAG: N-formylglutamate amidohydrolase [Marinibacterium sp.]|nr:N-formylglutamate amidohydrolase [Marinibacterium sp.]
MTESAYVLTRPTRLTSRVVFASPHSGRSYDPAFLDQSILGADLIRSSEDAFVDDLFAAAPDHGAPFLQAVQPRAYLDLNRSPDELDPALIHGVPRRGHNPRVASGLGVVPRVVANGRSIYRGKIPLAEAERRIDTIWKPYHQALQDLLYEAWARFGSAILLDCHSMPREAVDNTVFPGGRRPDIVLGDRFGASAAPDIVDHVESAFASAGLRVARNAPFAGAFITQAYGRPSRNQHAIQIEIDRSVYMDEARIAPNAQYDAFRDLLRGVIADLAVIGGQSLPLAAE